MKHILLILACFILASCSSSYYGQSMVASTKVAAVPKNYSILGKVEAKSCGTFVFFFPVSSVYFKKMYETTQKQAMAMGGDAVIDFQIRTGNKIYIFPYFFVQDCYTTTGTAIKFIDGASAWDAAPSSGESGSSVWDSAPPSTKEKEIKSTWD